MAFHAKTQRSFLAILFLIPITNIVYSVITNSFGGLFYYYILLALFLITAFFINYTFTIQSDRLTYEVSVLTTRVYKRVIYPHQLNKIEFKRYGWSTPGALVRVKKGFNMRLVLFSPSEIFRELLTFAYNHEIPTSKTKDYQLLERRNKYIQKERIL
ncbi:hypothetical protein [Bacillus sp. FJAT-22090]|uniref:hypothetical protein n=1 Tax=Bacillus sp. FJAT-22090 TaxID=1581038 RepID=UPI00119EC687|nr:hypothetical protein [Bacillus sp. FJAT-22090]